MKERTVSALAAIILLAACHEKESVKPQLKKIDTAWLDSVIKHSDSSYSKKYKAADFAKADYYLDRKDSSVCQVMRDTAGNVRQVIISKKNLRTYFAQYYSNGQLQADLKLDLFGQYDGPAVYYYENGAVKSKGVYKDGLSSGEWIEYKENGDSAIIKYNADGNRVN